MSDQFALMPLTGNAAILAAREGKSKKADEEMDDTPEERSDASIGDEGGEDRDPEIQFTMT